MKQSGLFVSRADAGKLMLGFGILAAAAAAVGSGFTGNGIGKAAAMTAVEVLCLFLPGLNITMRLNIDYRNRLVLFFCSYAAGYLISILIYIVMLLLGIQSYCIPVYAIFALLNAVWMFAGPVGKYREAEKMKMADWILPGLLFVLVAVVFILTYILPNRSPVLTGYKEMNQDLIYWFKNCVAATKGYPLPELSISGLSLYWHLFSCFEVAFLHFMTGIEIFDLCFGFAFFWKSMLLLGGTYTLALCLLQKKRYIYPAILMILFSSGADVKTYVFYQYHLYRCSLAFEEGYAVSMFGFFFFLDYLNSERKSIGRFLLVQLFFAGALGLKASGGTILLAGICIGSFLEFLGKNKRKIIPVLTVLCSAALFVLISKVFIIDNNALASATSSHHLNISFTGTLFRSGYFENLYISLKEAGFVKYLSFIIAAGLFVLQSNWAVFSAVILGAIAGVTGRARELFLERTNLILAGMILSGICIFFLTEHPGYSQVYFMFEIFAFAGIYGIRLIEGREFSGSFAKPVLMAGLLLITCLSIWNNAANWKRIFLLNDSEYRNDFTKQGITGNAVSGDEVTGLRWVRDNLPEDVLLLTSRAVCDGNFRTFVTSAYSQRQVYLEGYGSANLPGMEMVEERRALVRDYCSGVPGASEKLLEEGVTHAVLFTGGEEIYDSVYGKVVFQNDAVKVVQLESN